MIRAARRTLRSAFVPVLLGSLLCGASAPLPAQSSAPQAEAPTDAAPPAPEPIERSERHAALFGTEGELPLAWVEGLEWRSIGPANMGGRMLDIAVHPGDSATYWVGSATGGILKTENRGLTYEHQFTDQAVSSIGALAVSPADPDVLWVGTGEPNPRNSVSWGDGVYRSEDGGATFRHVGLDDTFQIGAIVAHPTDRDVAYVAALGRLWGPNEARGLFRTTDGGATWDKVLYVDEDTGVVDVIMKPDDPRTLIAASYERRRDVFDTNDPAKKWGEGGGLWRTTDGGDTWSRLTAGLPSSVWGRTGLDWYQGDPNVVYAVIETERITQLPEDAAYFGLTGVDGDEVGVRVRRIEETGPAKDAAFQEGDLIVTFDGTLVTGWSELVRALRDRKAGETAAFGVMRGKESLTVEVTFSTYPSEEEDADEETGPRSGPFSSGLGGQVENVQDQQGDEGHEFGGVYRSDDAGQSWERVNSVNPRPMYYSQIRVDPSDDAYVYVLGTSLYRSSDGGRTFTADGAGRDVHVDHHALWIDPEDGRHILLGNDGGIYVTYDRMENWDHHNHVAMGQFYAVESDRAFDYRVYGGLQDNGSWGGPVTVDGQGPANEDWFRVGGGDGFVCRVDPEDPDLVYYESQNGGMGRIHLATMESGFFRPRGSRETPIRFHWKTPFLLSNHNSRIYYAAGNYVFRSLNRGDDLRRISPEITASERGAATALAESPREPDLLYVGTDDGALWRTRDGGTTWEDLFELNGVVDPALEAIEGPDAASITTDAGERLERVTRAPRAGQGAGYERGDDLVGGTWAARPTGVGEQAPNLRLELVAEEDGGLAGSVDSVLGPGEIREGSFERASGALVLRGVAGGVGFTVKATLEQGVLAGRLTGGGGLVDVSFEAVRTHDGQGSPIAPAVEVAASVEHEEAASVAQGEAPAAADAPAQASRPANAQEGEPDPEGIQEEPAEPPAEGAPEFLEGTIDQLLPQRMHVSSLVASHHREGRVYATFDGHRSDDTLPYVFRSEDAGSTWDSIRANLPDAAGSARVIVEDPLEQDLLILGTEFGAFVSIDRGESWTRLNANLPTVPVHDFSINEASGEIVAATHGRSLWVLDMALLRELDDKSLRAPAHLFAPGPVVSRERSLERGSTIRRFVGEGRPAGVTVSYALARKAPEVALFVEDATGQRVAELDASGEPGLHRQQWNLRATSNEGERRRRWRQVDPGTYWVVLQVGDETQRVALTVP